MFDTYDIDGNGFIDKDEYWAITSQLEKDSAVEWTRAMSDLEVEDIDTNKDGVISPEEFYRHCRTKLAANRATFDEAMRMHQDVFFSPKELDSALLNTSEYVESVLNSHDLRSTELPSSPLGAAILAKKARCGAWVLYTG